MHSSVTQDAPACRWGIRRNCKRVRDGATRLEAATHYINPTPHEPTTTYTPASPIPLDSFARKILAAVQANNLQPHRVIAQAVALPAPAVARRLQRLQDDGIIRADVSLVQAPALGRPLRAIVEVCVDSELPSKLQEAKALFLGCAQVQHCYYTAGEGDFVRAQLQEHVRDEPLQVRNPDPVARAGRVALRRPGSSGHGRNDHELARQAVSLALSPTLDRLQIARAHSRSNFVAEA
jgi:DNA-binding Lrp family transcriptional regulator